MKVTYQHEVTTSFVLWFDNYLLSKGEAYSNITGKYYYTADDRLMDAAPYSSPYKQWVTDSSICLLYTSPSPRDQRGARMPASA